MTDEALVTSDVFVGRGRELATFRAALAAAGHPRASVLLLSGEPGIGKTRLASEVAVIAAQRGFQVHWGRCWEAGGAPAYWPWIEVVRSCLRTPDLVLPSTGLAAQTAHLAMLVPELRERFPALPDAEPTSDTDRARFQLFEGTAAFLRFVAAARPLMIVIDDLHAADHSSLLMLQFVARHLRDVPLVLVGCYRDTELRAVPAIAAVLVEVVRDGQHLALHGLPERDVELFMSARCPTATSPAVVSTVRTVTGGNPFFLGELARQLSAESDLGQKMPLPDGVREAVRSRLRCVSSACLDLLTLASILGQQFGLPALAAAARLSTDRTAAVLEEAVAARLVAARDGALGHYAFFHGLIREVLYENLTANTRAALHGAVGAALERLHGADDDTHLATLAHHFFMAAAHGETDKAIAFCTRAGDRALRQLAAPEAVEHFGRALQALSLSGGDTAPRRCALLVRRGRALERVGDFEAAREDFMSAAAIARELGDTDAFADAALGCGEQWALKFTCSIVDKSDLPLLEQALRMTSPEPHGVRATLLARTASALFYSGVYRRGRDVSAAAVEMARQLRDDEALARALSVRHAVLLGPDGLAERFRVVEEIERLADATGNREVRLRAHVLRLYDLVERGDVEEAEPEVLKIMRLVNEIGDPFEQWHCGISQSAAALFHGRLAVSEQLARSAFEAAYRVPGQQRSDQNAPLSFRLQTSFLRRERRMLDGLADETWAMAEQAPTVVGWRAVTALVDLDLGRSREAAGRVDRIGMRALSAIPPDSAWVGTMFVLAEVFARLEDRARCRHVAELLEPYAELQATLASPVWLGGVTRALGMLASALERWDDATSRFEHALAWHADRDAPLWLGHTQIDYAEMLVRRGAPGDHGRAGDLLALALETASTLDAARLARRGADLRERLERVPSRTAARSRNEVPAAAPLRACLRREGEYWTIADATHTARLKHSRGLVMLSCLLARAGQEIHAVDLVRMANPPPMAELGVAESVHGADLTARRSEATERQLDTTARAAYRERLAELRMQVDEARSHNDPYRVERAQAEIHQLTAELKRDLGIGHGRRSGTQAERARLNATRAIRSAVVRIEAAHPRLGEHFRSAIRTGTFCVYEPHRASLVVWDS